MWQIKEPLISFYSLNFQAVCSVVSEWSQRLDPDPDRVVDQTALHDTPMAVPQENGSPDDDKF